MEPNKLDPETLKVRREGDELAQLVKGTGWGIAKHMLIDRVMKLADNSTIDTSRDAVSIAEDVKVNQRVVKELMGWLQEVEGRATQHNYQEEVLGTFKKEIIVSYFDSM